MVDEEYLNKCGTLEWSQLFSSSSLVHDTICPGGLPYKKDRGVRPAS